ncbi:UNVERIFIED_CONTAM: hypothetical protein Sangu_1959900 [Sesamum angustifolium]|uniref:Uncharacterized protein n=1 Tax=Sesamum angustifolium TaxID=2727405 RepID=A0AAW2LYU9_9LAMI
MLWAGDLEAPPRASISTSSRQCFKHKDEFEAGPRAPASRWCFEVASSSGLFASRHCLQHAQSPRCSGLVISRHRLEHRFQRARGSASSTGLEVASSSGMFASRHCLQHHNLEHKAHEARLVTSRHHLEHRFRRARGTLASSSLHLKARPRPLGACPPNHRQVEAAPLPSSSSRHCLELTRPTWFELGSFPIQPPTLMC